MAQMEGINPNISRRGSYSSEVPEGDMILLDNGENVDVWSIEWRDIEHAYDWYNQYASLKGFSIRKNSGNKNKEFGYWTYKAFVCSKEGTKKEKDPLVAVKRERPNTRCGCLAGMTVQRQRSGKYCVFDWNSQHNHELATPRKVHLLRSHRSMTESQRAEAIDSDRVGIRPKLAVNLMSEQAGGRQLLGFTQQDYKKFLNGRRTKTMEVGVAGVLLNWFGNQFRNHSEFYFRVMLDEDEHITSVFWSDHAMQSDYAIFGDFVSFDTTYRTNNEHRPLRAFLGVNHHRKSIIFGACLLFDETAQTFTWLFQTFVECMNGKAPISLFTDQDSGMLAAIPDALPATHHFLCVWHISQNAMKNLGALLGNKDFKGDWNDLLFDPEIDDFEQSWNKMIDKYKLQGNVWLQRIYEKREKWAPKYVRNVFCAGKKTTQISENFNSILRRFLRSDMNMDRFLKNFQRAVDELRYNELVADFKMLQTVHIKESGDPLSDHAAEVYTPTMLVAFMEQDRAAGYVKLDCRRESSGIEEVDVHVCSRDRSHNCSTAKRYVIKIENGVHHCSCKRFNFVGVVCNHIIWLLKQKGLFTIPDAYILPRWRRDARKLAPSSSSSHTTTDPTLLRVVNRRRYVNQFASMCHQYGARTKSWTIFDRYYQGLQEELAQLSDDEDPTAPISVGSRVGGHIDIVAKGFKYRPPKHKGNKRLKSALELRSTRGRARGRGGARASSQPVARPLPLFDELELEDEEEGEEVDEDEDEDEEEGEEVDEGEDESVTGRFRSLDEL